MGQGHCKLDISERQWGHKPKTEISSEQVINQRLLMLKQSEVASAQTSTRPPKGHSFPLPYRGPCSSRERWVSPGTSLPQRRCSPHRPLRWSAFCAVDSPRKRTFESLHLRMSCKQKKNSYWSDCNVHPLGDCPTFNSGAVQAHAPVKGLYLKEAILNSQPLLPRCRYPPMMYR